MPPTVSIERLFCNIVSHWIFLVILFFPLWGGGGRGRGRGQMMVVMKRVKWDGSTTGSKLTASIAQVHDELKVRSPTD